MSNSDSQQTYLNVKRALNPRVPTHRGNNHCIASYRSFTFFCMDFCLPVNEDITVIGVSIQKTGFSVHDPHPLQSPKNV